MDYTAIKLIGGGRLEPGDKLSEYEDEADDWEIVSISRDHDVWDIVKLQLKKDETVKTRIYPLHRVEYLEEVFTKSKQHFTWSANF
ncbi:MAG TPA: hypothetical protein GX720_03010 [Clostridiaceae bacterium]|nr:hypothetical protein [Clostridiaceae bacterium]